MTPSLELLYILPKLPCLRKFSLPSLWPWYSDLTSNGRPIPRQDSRPDTEKQIVDIKILQACCTTQDKFEDKPYTSLTKFRTIFRFSSLVMTGEDSLLVNGRWFWIGRLGSGPLTDLEIKKIDGLFPKPKVVFIMHNRGADSQTLRDPDR